MRYGMEADLQPDQLVIGEWAVAKDTKKVWMCFRPGLVLRMSTYEAFEQDMREIQLILATCQDIQAAVERFKQLADQHASQAEAWSAISKSWAIGGTGTREGEDTDNSKYYSEQSKSEADRAKNEADRAAAIAGIDIDSELSETSANPVQNRVITNALNNKLSLDGDASNLTIEFDQEEERKDLSSGDKLSVFASKIKKWLADLKPVAFTGNYTDLTDRLTLTNNLLATVSGTALDASMGKVLDDKISQINSNLAMINSTLTIANVTSSITLPANMTTGTELCRTAILQPGLYLIGYRMSNYNLDTIYYINLSTTGNYVTILAGQNGVDVVRLTSPATFVITAQNKGDKSYVVGASGNNRMFALRLK